MKAHDRTVHLIYGPTAAGKSTYAQILAADINGVRFAVDEWMHALYSADVPGNMDLNWALTRVARCQAQIWSLSQRILATGTDVVLELGLLRKMDRDAMKSKVEAAGYATTFHFVDADLSVRRQRVTQRNAQRGETYSFEVTPKMFEAMEAYFERPSGEERERSPRVRGSQD